MGDKNKKVGDKIKKLELTSRNMKSTPRNKIFPHESLKEGKKGQIRLVMTCVISVQGRITWLPLAIYSKISFF